jgi:hypothetical protein
MINLFLLFLLQCSFNLKMYRPLCGLNERMYKVRRKATKTIFFSFISLFVK